MSRQKTSARLVFYTKHCKTVLWHHNQSLTDPAWRDRSKRWPTTIRSNQSTAIFILYWRTSTNINSHMTQSISAHSWKIISHLWIHNGFQDPSVPIIKDKYQHQLVSHQDTRHLRKPLTISISLRSMTNGSTQLAPRCKKYIRWTFKVPRIGSMVGCSGVSQSISSVDTAHGYFCVALVKYNVGLILVVTGRNKLPFAFY